MMYPPPAPLPSPPRDPPASLERALTTPGAPLAPVSLERAPPESLEREAPVTVMTALAKAAVKILTSTSGV